jgi:mersacidin/lichenicidin family type 2 lantibiotic
MSKTISGKDVIRAWKDAEYRESLSAEERAALPNHPAGLVDLSDAELEMVRGAIEANPRQTIMCPTDWERCPLTSGYTFAAPDPRDGCQISVNNWTCTDLPKL